MTKLELLTLMVHIHLENPLLTSPEIPVAWTPAPLTHRQPPPLSEVANSLSSILRQSKHNENLDSYRAEGQVKRSNQMDFSTKRL